MVNRAAEIIAMHLNRKVEAIEAARRKPTSYFVAAFYEVDGEWYCAPRRGQRPPKGHQWEVIGSYFGRDLYRRKNDGE